MSRFKLLYFVIFIINLHKINAQISDKRLCVDEECKVPISLAKTLLRYSSPDSRILSFAPNADITIYSKSAGSREDLWGGEINGKRGYVPKHMVRETKVLQKPTRLVDTEFSNDTETNQVPSQVEPDKVQEPYEVVDGTTIYLSPQDNINPTSTDSPIQPTALPAETLKNGEPESGHQTPSQDEAVDSELKQSHEESAPHIEEEAQIDTDFDGIDDETEEVEADDEVEEDEDEETEETEEYVEEVENNTDEGVTEEAVQAEKESSSSTEEEISTQKNAEVDAETATLNEDVASLSSENKESEQEDQKSEEQVLPIQPAIREISEAPDAESEPEPASVPELVQSLVDAVTASYNNEETVPPILEVTTLSPEFEVPQPLDDDFLEVTQNPLEAVAEEIKKPQDQVPTLPPLGLFGGFNTEAGQTEQVKIDESVKVVEGTEGDDPQSAEGPSFDVDASIHEESRENNASQETTEAVVSQETTEPVVSQETTETVVSQETSEAVVSQETAEAVVSQETAEAVVSQETAEAVVSQETAEAVVSQETAEAVVSQETTEAVVSEGAFEDSLSNEDVEGNDTDQIHDEEEVEEAPSPGFFAGIMSIFNTASAEEPQEESAQDAELAPDAVDSVQEEHVDDDLLSTSSKESFCDATSCPKGESNDIFGISEMDFLNFNFDVFLYLVTTAISVIIFLFGYIVLDKSKREGPLVAKINNLEKELLIVLKEKEILQDKLATDSGYENNGVSNEVAENLKQELLETTAIKSALEEQVQSLEKELENSTEVGMELNRMLSEILSSESGSDVLKGNVEHLQRQLIEQQSTVNSVNETLAITNTENHELRLELELSNKKVFDLQAELDKLLLNILKIEEEKETQQSTLEAEVANVRRKYEEIHRKFRSQEEEHGAELEQLKTRLDETQRKLELKSNEHDILVDNLKQLKSVKNNAETIRNIIDAGDVKAEMRVLKSENQKFAERIRQEQDTKVSTEKRAQAALEESRLLREKYEEADKSRVEAQTKLEVLSNYFKDREAQWQKEISKHEALWAEKEGEATSTTERIKFMQEQLQNYKVQTESLKQEIMSQEIELKSQISVLEKKAHENWVSARQAERKLEEAKQEAAQLRHRLTLRERAIQEDKNQQRLQSPIEQNGDMSLESPASPPLLYGTRDHITKSPPLSGLPPFLPPPPGVPFMPPPLHGVPPFIPPPPNMFPGDHRPPPLGRMSSPPLNSRYSPSSRGYSPYDRNSSSPSDSEYGNSPPHRRGYSPFNNRMEDRREYKRPLPGRSNGRNMIKGGGSSGSGHSNESLEKISRQQSKV